MNIYADKTLENKNQAVNVSLSKQQSNPESTFQFEDNRREAVVQRQLQNAADQYVNRKVQPVQKENNTGLPDHLKNGIEQLSGFSMDDVKVHYNSDKPAQLQAHAYAQGTDIHVASGQEKHLPHEAWHVVQQKQGRVKPTLQLKGKVDVNDDLNLEKEADVMGAKSVEGRIVQKKGLPVVQKMLKRQKLNIQISRPGFVGAVNTMRVESQDLYPLANIHMAHRLSYNHIKQIVMSNNLADIQQLMSNIAIPKRDFGDPKKGGVKSGNSELYNVVEQLYKLWLKDPYGRTPQLIQALNSSPYNLRPGDGQVNSSIGEHPDAHFDERYPNEPMTPQSKALLPANTNQSSDFMNMDGFSQWEADFGNYLALAVASVQRML